MTLIFGSIVKPACKNLYNVVNTPPQLKFEIIYFVKSLDAEDILLVFLYHCYCEMAVPD